MIGKKNYPADIRRKEIRNLRTSPKSAGKNKKYRNWCNQPQSVNEH